MTNVTMPTITNLAVASPIGESKVKDKTIRRISGSYCHRLNRVRGLRTGVRSRATRPASRVQRDEGDAFGLCRTNAEALDCVTQMTKRSTPGFHIRLITPKYPTSTCA